MDTKKQKTISIEMKKILEKYIQREERLRLSWFRKNEERLMEIANKPNTKAVPPEIRKQLADNLRNRFANEEKFVTEKHDDGDPQMDFDLELATRTIMKPVDSEVKQLLYKGTEKEGRATYLKERYKLIPEKRYYFPEATSFEYGWKMWDCAKELRGSKFGRQQVIRDSFYRKANVERDPDWYKEPAKLSPTVCGNI